MTHEETVRTGEITEINSSSGVKVIFDGESVARDKYFLCNSALSFAVGDRVKIAWVAGTWVVEYPIGKPKQTGGSYPWM